MRQKYHLGKNVLTIILGYGIMTYVGQGKGGIMTTGLATSKEASIMTNGYIRTTEAAKRFGVSSRTIARWIEKGYFPNAFKINPHADNAPFLIPLYDIEALERKREAKKE